MKTNFRIPTVLAALGLAGTANAADLAYRKPPAIPVLAKPGFSWTGFYVGAHGGHAWGRDITREYVTATWVFIGLQNRFKPEGFFGGVHGGANYQFSNNVVVGLEADLDYGDIRSGFNDPPAAPANPGGRGRFQMQLQGSVRARLGYALGNVLLYGTGGIAMGEYRSQYFDWPGSTEIFRRTLIGYTVGAGAEYAITNNITVRGEYRFTEYAKVKNHITAIPTFVGFSGTQQPNFHTLRGGVTYKF